MDLTWHLIDLRTGEAVDAPTITDKGDHHHGN
jgi:hypothetical protein